MNRTDAIAQVMKLIAPNDFSFLVSDGKQNTTRHLRDIAYAVRNVIAVDHPSTLFTIGESIGPWRFPSSEKDAVHVGLTIDGSIGGNPAANRLFAVDGSYGLQGVVLSVILGKPELNQLSLVRPLRNPPKDVNGCCVIQIDRCRHVSVLETWVSHSPVRFMHAMLTDEMQPFHVSGQAVRDVTDDADRHAFPRIKETTLESLPLLAEFLLGTAKRLYYAKETEFEAIRC